MSNKFKLIATQTQLTDLPYDLLKIVVQNIEDQEPVALSSICKSVRISLKKERDIVVARAVKDRLESAPRKELFLAKLEELSRIELGSELLNNITTFNFFCKKWFDDECLNKLVHKLPHLQVLDLRNTGITDINVLSSLTQLKTLHLRITDRTDISELSSLTQLQELYLSYSDITSEGLTHISSLTQLKILDLSYTGITNEALTQLFSLIQLETFYIYGIELTNEQIGQLRGALPEVGIIS